MAVAAGYFRQTERRCLPYAGGVAGRGRNQGHSGAVRVWHGISYQVAKMRSGNPCGADHHRQTLLIRQTRRFAWW